MSWDDDDFFDDDYGGGYDSYDEPYDDFDYHDAFDENDSETTCHYDDFSDSSDSHDGDYHNEIGWSPSKHDLSCGKYEDPVYNFDDFDDFDKSEESDDSGELEDIHDARVDGEDEFYDGPDLSLTYHDEGDDKDNHRHGWGWWLGVSAALFGLSRSFKDSAGQSQNNVRRYAPQKPQKASGSPMQPRVRKKQSALPGSKKRKAHTERKTGTGKLKHLKRKIDKYDWLFGLLCLGIALSILAFLISVSMWH